MASFRYIHRLIAVLLLSGCAGLPPGADYPRHASSALAHPDQAGLGGQFATEINAHGAESAFRILNVGVDGLLTRVQLIGAARYTLDVQYFIFRGDETGRRITAALLRAADRGVRVRILVDDGDTLPGDEQILALNGHPLVEVRVFNPFAYRGHARARRALEFAFNKRRLDYRMHNKLMVADNVAALIGGRNIGNEYFQVDPEAQVADDDVFSVGPVVQQLSSTFDEYWNSGLAIPAEGLGGGSHAAATLVEHRRATHGARSMQALDSPGIDYDAMIASGEPYAGMISGRLPMVWANAQVVVDSPNKKDVDSGARSGRLMSLQVQKAVAAAHSEILMITPYFIPSTGEIHMLDTALHGGVHVSILTNSLESATAMVPQAGYVRFRKPLLDEGARMYEIRALLGNQKGSGQTASISKAGNFSLHAKVFVLDRERLFIGSMNFDERSRHLNTEIGLIIDSTALAQQDATRFDRMTQPENAYVLALRDDGAGHAKRLVWDTVEEGQNVEYRHEPAHSRWQRVQQWLMTLLPVRSEL